MTGQNFGTNVRAYVTRFTSLWTFVRVTEMERKIVQMYICVYMCADAFLGTIYPTPPLGQDMTQGQFLSGV